MCWIHHILLLYRVFKKFLYIFLLFICVLCRNTCNSWCVLIIAVLRALCIYWLYCVAIICIMYLLFVLYIYCLYYVTIVYTMYPLSILCIYCLYYVSIFCTMYLLFVLCIYCLYYVSIVFTWRRTTVYLDAGRPARSQWPEGPATDHLDTGFSWFSWVLEQMLGWFPLFNFPSCHYMLPM
jgi:hypothetical protein